MNPCDYFLWGYLKDRLYRINPHNVQDLQAEFEAVIKEITGDMLRNKVDNSVVLLRVREVEGSHIEHVFTRKPHARKLYMKVNVRSSIICFCTLENYE
jgi:peptide methionine sulfoxide reductase MsrB